MKCVTLLTAALAVSLLSGCGKTDNQEQKGQEQEGVAADGGATDGTEDKGGGLPSASFRIKPGLWESNFQVDVIEMDGMPKGTPPGMMDQMKSAMNKSALRYCVTPEEAERPKADFLTGQKKSNCTYKHMDMGGGKINAEVVCEQPDGKGRTQSKMTGRYAPGSYEMAMDMQSSGMGDGMAMRMKAKTSGKWIASECPADLKS